MLLILVALTQNYCSESKSANNGSNKVTLVETRTLKPSPFFEYIDITGTVKARNQINIIAEEGGLLRKVNKNKGTMVRRGDTLAVLEQKVITAAYNEAKAALKQAELTFNSNRVLFDRKAISENDYLASKYNLDRVQSAYDLAKARYDKLFITAPLSGLINNRYYDDGAYVMPMTPLFELIDNERVKIEAGVAARFFGDIRVGTPVILTFDAYPGVVKDAQVNFVSKSIDPLNRTFTIEVELDNSDQLMVTEMIANVRLLRRVYENEIVIPIDALMNSEQGQYVYLNENNLARRKGIDILAIYGDSVLVKGLETNQQLIVFGQQDLSDGEVIEVRN